MSVIFRRAGHRWGRTRTAPRSLCGGRALPAGPPASASCRAHDQLSASCSASPCPLREDAPSAGRDGAQQEGTWRGAARSPDRSHPSWPRLRPPGPQGHAPRLPAAGAAHPQGLKSQGRKRGCNSSPGPGCRGWGGPALASTPLDRSLPTGVSPVSARRPVGRAVLRSLREGRAWEEDSSRPSVLLLPDLENGNLLMSILCNPLSFR